MSFTVELIISAFLILGGLFVLVGSIGLIRLQDFYVRLHAPTKATTLGLGCILIASIVHHPDQQLLHVCCHGYTICNCRKRQEWQKYYSYKLIL